MRRSIHITAALIGFLLLLKPFDCFSATGMTRKAACCCAKGKCVPTKDSDCCRQSVPDSQQYLSAAHHASVHSLPIVEIAEQVAATCPQSPQLATELFSKIHSPPGSPPESRLNLPLLI
jgi:hypothetical protein